MNRTNKMPCCSHCNTNYQIGDVYGPKNPMLLVCGHDMCRNCIKYLYKKNKQVICKVCQADCMIKCDDEISNIPIHYFIVGKVWYSSYSRQHKIYQDIFNIRMTSKSLMKTKENCQNCQNCQKYAAIFCEQCDETYCEDCSQEIHMENHLMSQHDLNKLDTTHLEFLQASKCDLHLKINDFICITCKKELCPVCAVENHRDHELLHLEKYNISQAQRLNEYSLKGDILLKRLKHYRDKFNEKVQKHRCSNFKKNKNEQDRKSISTYVSSVIGTLQCLEQRLFSMIDQAEQSSSNSMTHVVGQLSSFIDDLQTKLNILDVLLKNNNYSSIAMLDHIAGIERMLDMTYYLAKKNKAKSSIMFDENIYAAVQSSVSFDIDTSDRYVLGCSPDLLPEYTLSATIGLYSDDNNALSETRLSSVSSMLSSTMSMSSNYSAISGAEAAAVFGDVSASSADAAASATDTRASSVDAGASSVDAEATFADAGATFADAGASSVDDNTSDDSVVDCPLQSQVVKEIMKNQVEVVVVSHLNSPSDFYVQLNANLGMLDMVNSKLERHVKSKHGSVPVGPVEIDSTIMYAVQTSANKWCRGIVLHTFNENNTDLFRVHFIDYGFMETVTADRIKSLPVTVVSIPPLAYNCAIYDLKPKYTTGWSNEAYILFNDLMSSKTGLYFIYPLDIKDLRIEVDVVWNGDIYPLSIRDAMFFLGYGSYEYYVNKQLHQELVNMITLPDNLKLEEEKRYSVILCHFISPTEFYMRIADDTAQLEEVMNALKTIYIPTAENTHKSYLLFTPQIGMAVAARYSIDGHWHRAKITSLPEERLVTVFYIDFGNSETLPWDELRVLDKNLIKTPPLVIKASLADVNPAVDGVESTKWSDNACAAFLNFSKIDYADNDLIAFIHKVDGDTHKIVLYNRSSRAEICLNSKLVSQGYATTMDPISCVFKKTNIRKQVKQPVLINSRNKEVILPSDDTLSFTKLRSVTESENHSWKNKKLKFPGMPMSIVKVVSPDEIILKKMNFNTEILTEKMNKAYGDEKKNKTILGWKINDLCAILIKKYGNWYRGKIININIIKHMVTVYFYDLNETIDEIPIKTLHVLEEECAKLKCGILHCGLNNLVPLGASDGIWPKFSCDRLIEELKKYPTVYFSNQGKENDIVLGEIWVRVIDIPRALEPIREHWTNINKFMIEQGFALSKKQVKMDDEYSTSSQSESEFKYSSVPKKNDEFVNSWMPPTPLVKSQFNAIVTNVDLECHVFFQILDDETLQSLQLVMDELNYIFSNSQPEPINMKWNKGQSVIVQYYRDKKWYRGTILKLVFSFGLPLCKLLQKEQIDLREAASLAEDIINVLKNIRLNCDTEFHKLFLLAKEMSVIIDIDLSTKRISKRQVNRANPDPNLSVEEYHKVSVFIPYLDFFIQQLGERFSIHSEIFKGFQSLFSYTLTSNEEVSFRKLLEFYSPSLDVNNSIAELKLWKIKLERINNIPKTAIEALHVCNANIYPNVHFILKILCTLPVSTSTPERMFSSLKRIKTYLRNSMSEIDEEGEFTVQFYDYGNIEKCKHEELRSTLYTTEVPRLCHEGFFSAILPITKNGKWPILSLDHIHTLIVDKTCRMTIDENLSTDDVCAIKSLKIIEDNFDVFQYLVTDKMAYFEYVPSSIIDLVDTDEINNGDAADVSKCEAANYNISNATYDNGHDDCTTYVDGGSIYDSGGLTYGERRQTYDNGVVTVSAADEERATSIGAPDVTAALIVDEDAGEESDYSKFCLERNEVVEGTMGRITGPTSLTLVIQKIGGVDLSIAKNDMHKVIFNKCSTLPPPNHIVPGTAVIVYHNILWRRGVVEDGGKSVFLVDFGMSIKLVKKNLRRCIAEFFELPMFTIDCRLENFRPSDDADAEDVVDKLSKTLRGVSLKIIGISESDDGDIVGVELYNSKEEIAYQSLIDANLLIPAK